MLKFCRRMKKILMGAGMPSDSANAVPGQQLLERMTTSNNLSVTSCLSMTSSRLPFLETNLESKVKICLELDLLEAACAESNVQNTIYMWQMYAMVAQAGLRLDKITMGDRLALRGVLLHDACVHASMEEAIDAYDALLHNVDAASRVEPLPKEVEAQCRALLELSAERLAMKPMPVLFERGPLLASCLRLYLIDLLPGAEGNPFNSTLVSPIKRLFSHHSSQALPCFPVALLHPLCLITPLPSLIDALSPTGALQALAKGSIHARQSPQHRHPRATSNSLCQLGRGACQ